MNSAVLPGAVLDAAEALQRRAQADTSVLNQSEFENHAACVDDLKSIVDSLVVGVAADAQLRGHDKANGFLSAGSWVRRRFD